MLRGHSEIFQSDWITWKTVLGLYAAGQSPGEADTRFMHDRQMPPPSQSFMAQNGPAEAGAGPMSRVHNAEGMGPSTGGARALGTPDIQPGFAGAPNAMNLTPGMLESLGPLVSQLMSVGGLSSFASLQVIASSRNASLL